MTPEQFYDPDKMQQAEVIREGKHIADRQDNEHNILLYKIDDLYVEVFYSREHSYIEEFNPLKNNESHADYFPAN
jgi:hypothetical protein